MPRSEPRQIGELDLQVEKTSSRVLLRLTGKVTVESSPHLRDQLLAVLNDAALDQVMIDLTGVPYLDLSGIATLIEALKIARAKRSHLVLMGLQDGPHYLLEVSGVLPFFEEANDTRQDATVKGQE